MQRLKSENRAGIVAGISGCVLSAVFAPAAHATVYTVLNPGFENPNASAGDVAGTANWLTVAGGAFTTATTSHTGAQSGKAFGNPGLYQQTIAVTDPVGTSYTASVYAGNLDLDPLTGSMGGFINIDFLNSTGGLITTVTGGEEGSSLTSADAKGYKQILVTAPSVAGTASIRIDLVAGPYSAVSGNAGGAVFFDDATLTSATGTPEPASLAVVGLAGAGLLTRRRKTA